jgi:hypothetical protein
MLAEACPAIRGDDGILVLVLSPISPGTTGRMVAGSVGSADGKA